MPNGKVVGISQFGLSWVGREGGSLESHPYLFISKKAEEPFIEAQKSLHELNDFCVTLFESLRIKTSQQSTLAESLDQAEDDDGQIDVLST